MIGIILTQIGLPDINNRASDFKKLRDSLSLLEGRSMPSYNLFTGEMTSPDEFKKETDLAFEKEKQTGFQDASNEEIILEATNRLSKKVINKTAKPK